MTESEYNRIYYQNHREEILSRAKRWYRENRERKREYDRIPRQSRGGNPERARRASQQYRKNNPEKMKAMRHQWYKNNPGRSKLYNLQRRAYMRSLSNTLTVREVIQKLSIGHCFYCGGETNLTLDHFVPLSKGGGTTRANMVVSCTKCNGSKHTSLPSKLLVQLPLPSMEEYTNDRV